MPRWRWLDRALQTRTQVMSPGAKLRSHWRGQGLKVQAKARESQVSEFESRYSVSLPPDFRNYFLCVNGMDDWPNDQDREGFSFWPLSEVRRVIAKAARHTNVEAGSYPEKAGLFAFADYLCWCWAYAIDLSGSVGGQGSVYAIDITDAPILMANSFASFVELYLVDSPILYGPPRG